MISLESGGVLDVVNAVAIVPINKEQIQRPVNTQMTANTRPAGVRAVLSPYLIGIKADFHSAENVARSTFPARFLLKCVH